MIIEPHTDETIIIRQCQAGNEDAYAILVDRYKSMVYNVAFRMTGDGDTAKDISQNSFIAAFGGIRQFKFGSRFSSWLYSIALNKCRDHLRQVKNTVSTDEIADVIPAGGSSPEQAAVEHQNSGLLQDALNELPEEYREVLILKHIEELEYQEISQITGNSIPALKVRAHRGREMLRTILEKAGVTHG